MKNEESGRKGKGIEEALERTGAVLTGHFRLASGLHSDRYLQCARLLAIPREARAVGKALAEEFRNHNVDAVVGPALGGVVLSFVVADALGVPGYFAEKSSDAPNGFLLRRGFPVPRGKRVLLVEDVITTGGSILRLRNYLRGLGAEIVGIGAIVDRRANDEGFVSKEAYRALVRIHARLYQEENCPLCAKGLPLDRPGSG
ncbi:MAG: orotate phosphoribosyltransferase [Candidatus Hydrogenedentota bacterium]|nr:MAG: orotate phosphoribosyltransferase [Candidatus Hydrogenedentota bacterium]